MQRFLKALCETGHRLLLSGLRRVVPVLQKCTDMVNRGQTSRGKDTGKVP
ncbi:hypothetical protein NMD1_01385 [Novosphingobium sp. MD-1]|nr:hypothetical protein NMD1_01385 [Novosphingobium sp. MD-1]